MVAVDVAQSEGDVAGTAPTADHDLVAVLEKGAVRAVVEIDPVSAVPGQFEKASIGSRIGT